MFANCVKGDMRTRGHRHSFLLRALGSFVLGGSILPFYVHNMQCHPWLLSQLCLNKRSLLRFTLAYICQTCILSSVVLNRLRWYA